MNKGGYWPYTPNTNPLYGLNEACDRLPNQLRIATFARHLRWGEGCRGARLGSGDPVRGRRSIRRC